MSSRFGSDKEVAAVTFNLKQQRLMEKTMNTLSLEESYALKLLEINKRIVKVNYGRMTDKVGQINSFLTPEEIKILNEMEASGNFKSLNSAPNFSPSLRISSAEKRLKLNTPRPNTAFAYYADREDPSSGRREKRCKSKQRKHFVATGNCQSDDEVTTPGHPSVSERYSRHSGDEVNSHSYKDKTSERRKERPKTAAAHVSSTLSSEVLPDHSKQSAKAKPRPVTAVQTSNTDPAPAQRRERVKTAPSLGKSQVQAPYSSHDGTHTEVRTLTSAAGSTPRCRSSAELIRASTDSNMASANFQERKMEMLKMEAQRGLEFESKKTSFLKKVGEHVKSNPIQVLERQSSKAPQPDQEHRQTEGQQRPKGRRLRRRHTAEFARISEDDYRKRLEDSWKDLSKCRYLRIPGHEAEPIAENTLVKNQMELLKIFQRNGQKRSFLKGVQL